jgi:hypothetical protein
LEETQRALRYTRLDGYPDGFHVARPSRADIDTGRRPTVVFTILWLTVAVTAYTDAQHFLAVATARLRADLTRVREEFDILDEPASATLHHHVRTHTLTPSPTMTAKTTVGRTRPTNSTRATTSD